MQHKTVEHGTGPHHPPDEATVRRELERVLASGSFQGSRRCQDFLYYVVDRALAGASEKIKERTLAVEVFQRDVGSDLDHDSIVRVGAREVRKRLLHYYATEGKDSALHIDLPTGAYVPVFNEPRAVPAEALEPPHNGANGLSLAHESKVPDAAAPGPGAPNRRRWLLLVAAVVLAVAGAILWRLILYRPAPFEVFWQPALLQKASTLLVQAHPIAYHPSGRVTRLDRQKNGSSDSQPQQAIHLPPEMLNGSDFVPAFDQYVGLGDSVAAMRISEMLVRRGRTGKLRLASKLDFADLRDTAAVLIGAFTNRWTVELMPTLRYRFSYCGGSDPCIIDSSTQKHWTLTGKADNGRVAQDFILICRLPHARTGGFVVIGAGLTQYGTGEVGRILSDPAALDPLLARLPEGWPSKNLQLVLHSEILGEAPAPPELIAWNVW